jgi:hypothetical protein
MAKRLCDDLTQEERIYLANLSYHDGFRVLKKLMEDCCRKATEEVIKLNPNSDNYIQNLTSLQQTSRAMNDFSASVLASVQWHRDEAISANTDADSELVVNSR